MIPRTSFSVTLLTTAFLMTSCASRTPLSPAPDTPLAGKIIVLDPGHGGTADTDSFRVGPTGEREEWVNLRVALLLRDMLEARGATVLMTRTDDSAVELKDRAMRAVDNKADVFLSIHHNATADTTVNFPIIYYHANASGNHAGVALALELGRRLAEALYGASPPISVVSDHTIFPGAGAAVLRHSYGIPGVIGEASFFSNPAEEQRLKDPDYNFKEAEAYLKTLEAFFSAPIAPMLDRYTGGRIPPLETLQESERMQDVAKGWREDYLAAEAILGKKPPGSGEEALSLFSRSARSFPDSPIAQECHERMATLLDQLGKTEDAALERRRAEEYYVLATKP